MEDPPIAATAGAGKVPPAYTRQAPEKLETGLGPARSLANVPTASVSPQRRAEGQPLLSTPRLLMTSGLCDMQAPSSPTSLTFTRASKQAPGKRGSFDGCAVVAAAAAFVALIGCVVIVLLARAQSSSSDAATATGAKWSPSAYSSAGGYPAQAVRGTVNPSIGTTGANAGLAAPLSPVVAVTAPAPAAVADMGSTKALPPAATAQGTAGLGFKHPTNIVCGTHKFCLGWEGDNVYCYGAPDRCMWGSSDCERDSDCSKYSAASPKHTDGISESCPGTEWRADAPCHTATPQQAAALQALSANHVGVNLHYPGYNCYAGHGAIPVPGKDHIGVMTLDACKAACTAESVCQGVTTIKGVSGKTSGSCWLRTGINLEACVRGTGYETWMKATSASPAPVVVNQKMEGVNCWQSGHGGLPVPGKDMVGEMTLEDCKAACIGEVLCKGIVVQQGLALSKCWLRMMIDLPRCDRNTPWDTYLKTAATPDDVQRLTAVPAAPASPPKRKASFLVLGDWGWDERIHGNAEGGCQPSIAKAMYDKFKELGDVKFVINVGDSFYPNGVSSKDDPQWDTKWRNVYAPELRSVPWYSVYGNHDLFADPCTCGDSISDCAQVNSDSSDLNYFYMPSYTFAKEHPELGLEIIAMDMNQFSWASEPWSKDQTCVDCVHSACPGKCRTTLKSRAEESYDLFVKRKWESTQPNLLVFSHYPTDYFASHPEFIRHLSDRSQHHILYFGGHRHSVDNTSTTSTLPNTNWLVGGGGGWGCDGPDAPQGFVVGEISPDNEITTYPVLIGDSLCCQLN